MSNTTVRLIRGVTGLVVVAVLLIVVTNWWGDYKHAASRVPSRVATSTADATGTVSGPNVTSTKRTATILIEGLNFRKQPQSGSPTIRGLKKDETLAVLTTKGDWYQVKDSNGVVGWIAAKSQYVKLGK